MRRENLILKQRGVTLVELLVSTAVMVIIFSMAINIYIAVKEQFVDLKNSTSVEIKELAAKRLIFDFVRNSGFACKFGYTAQTYYDRTGDGLASFFIGATGIRVGTLPLPTSDDLSSALEEDCSGECYQEGTDYIMVKKEQNNTKVSSANSLSTVLTVDSTADITAGDYLVLCNNESINLVKADSVDNNTSTVNLVLAPSGSIYYTGDYLGNYTLEIMYIRDTGDQDENGDDIYALYVYIKDSSSNGMSYELVRGLKDLQIEYASVSEGDITWNSVTTDLDIDKNTYPGIRVSFSVDGESFSKIIVL